MLKKSIIAGLTWHLLIGFEGPLAAAEIVVGHAEALVTLDPGNHRARTTETVLRNMYDGLVTRTPEMAVVPEIAESWEQRDPLTYAFKVRRGIAFHDGTPLTATDVKFTFDRLIADKGIAGETSPRRSLLGPLKTVTIEGDETVVFKLTDPWPIFPAMLPYQEIVSKSIVAEIGDLGLAMQVNGSGPFKLVEWRSGEYVLMERFAGYYGGSPRIPPVGPARVDRVRFRHMPNANERVLALLSGDVHIINDLPVSAIERLIRNSDVRVVKANSTRSFFIALDTRRPPFDDVRVRRAANHAIDRSAIIENLLQGFATPLNGVLSPHAFGFNPDLPAYGPDETKAKRLLAEAGYSEGQQLTLDVETAYIEIAQALASHLARVGLEVRVRAVSSWNDIRQMWVDEISDRGHMAFLHWGNGSLDPVGIFDPTLRSGGRGNFNGYSNPEVDRLLEAAGQELNREKRVTLYRRAQEIVNRDAPWIFLWLPQEIYGISARLRGWRPSSDGRINLHDAYLE
jgi:peptide/nickel transport system substrate-binding protein